MHYGVCRRSVCIGERCICRLTLTYHTPAIVLTSIQLSVVSKDEIMNTELDIASRFFENIFGSEVASRVMSGIIALSILGNIIVMTFTASRGGLQVPCTTYIRRTDHSVKLNRKLPRKASSRGPDSLPETRRPCSLRFGKSSHPRSLVPREKNSNRVLWRHYCSIGCLRYY
jgi:hypothetical protein